MKVARGLRVQLRWFRGTYNVAQIGGIDEAGVTPKDIVDELNRYVIGQGEAKKEVSVALRERWRRLQLVPEKAVEITPKNMLVSGPSGCGKTEIIRRVSKLLKAPFVKVDASTFTRRGVVGANVSDMVVDLYDSAEDQCKNHYADMVKAVARTAAIDILVDCMLTEFKALVARPPSATIHVSAPAPTTAPGPGSGTQSPSATERELNSDIGAVISKLHDTIKQGHVIYEQRLPNSNSSQGSGSGEEEEGNKYPYDFEGKTMEELVNMPAEEAKEVLKTWVKAEAATQGPQPRYRFRQLRQAIRAEEGDAEDSVTIFTSSPQDKPFPFFLLSGSQEAPTQHDSGTIRELVKNLQDKTSDALSAFRFSPHRSPVKSMVERWGIICIDEIDKVVGKKSEGGMADRWMNTDVQQELLTLIEGTKVNIESARALKSGGGLNIQMGGQSERVVVDTTHILFVCAGAFTLCKPKDMLVELLGRLPVRVAINSLTRDDLHEILTKTKYPMIQQQSDLFETEGVKLEWEDDAVLSIADIAFTLNAETENTGARVLNSILRMVLSDYSYNAASYRGQTITITKDHVLSSTRKLLPHDRLETYIL